MGQSKTDNNTVTSVATGQPTQPSRPEAAPPLTARMVLATLLTLPGNTWHRPKESDTERVHRAIFRRGYYIQSRVLRIPHRIGFFYRPPGTMPLGEGEDEESQGAGFAGVVHLYASEGRLNGRAWQWMKRGRWREF
ncbi:hypothetical protein NKR19_g5520 [Coniochaeta hoffmannii]|uniref:Uncharacterized protein n=1 Tax=Coniochaeta hoffmannii TaxID=91930 RepID=A0AA38RKD0_9PEZI|nr:hypothetical protein NKR19_g5520 [Coniochaeta hoffmannii]